MVADSRHAFANAGPTLPDQAATRLAITSALEVNLIGGFHIATPIQLDPDLAQRGFLPVVELTHVLKARGPLGTDGLQQRACALREKDARGVLEHDLLQVGGRGQLDHDARQIARDDGFGTVEGSLQRGILLGAGRHLIKVGSKIRNGAPCDSSRAPC